MPHSNKIRARKERIKRTLQKRVSNLQALSKKHLKDAQEIILPDVSLGDLRRRFKPTHQPLHPAIIRKVPKFIRMPSTLQPLMIRGSDNGLLVCRARINHPDLIQRLSDSIDFLDKYPPKHYKFKGINRSEYKTRHLGIWSAYMKV